MDDVLVDDALDEQRDEEAIRQRVLALQELLRTVAAPQAAAVSRTVPAIKPVAVALPRRATVLQRQQVAKAAFVQRVHAAVEETRDGVHDVLLDGTVRTLRRFAEVEPALAGLPEEIRAAVLTLKSNVVAHKVNTAERANEALDAILAEAAALLETADAPAWTRRTVWRRLGDALSADETLLHDLTGERLSLWESLRNFWWDNGRLARARLAAHDEARGRARQEVIDVDYETR